MVIEKEIVFTSLVYDTNTYHHSEIYILHFAWLNSCCDFCGGIPMWFQMLGHLVMNIFLFESDHTSACFGKTCVICTCPCIILGLIKPKCIFICNYAWMSKYNPFIYIHTYLILGQDTIIFQWSFIFASSTIRALIFTM